MNRLERAELASVMATAYMEEIRAMVATHMGLPDSSPQVLSQTAYTCKLALCYLLAEAVGVDDEGKELFERLHAVTAEWVDEKLAESAERLPVMGSA